MKRIMDRTIFDTADAVEIGRGAYTDELRAQDVCAALYCTRDGVYFGIEEIKQYYRVRGGSRTRTSREWYLPRDAEGARRFAEVHGVDLVRAIV
jgi:hypothetical protein